MHFQRVLIQKVAILYRMNLSVLLIQALEADNVIREHSHVITTSNGVHKIPVVATKGVANWIDEGGSYGDSDDVFGQEQIDAHKVGTIVEGIRGTS